MIHYHEYNFLKNSTEWKNASFINETESPKRPTCNSFNYNKVFLTPEYCKEKEGAFSSLSSIKSCNKVLYVED